MSSTTNCVRKEKIEFTKPASSLRIRNPVPLVRILMAQSDLPHQPILVRVRPAPAPDGHPKPPRAPIQRLLQPPNHAAPVAIPLLTPKSAEQYQGQGLAPAASRSELQHAGPSAPNLAHNSITSLPTRVMLPTTLKGIKSSTVGALKQPRQQLCFWKVGDVATKLIWDRKKDQLLVRSRWSFAW